jgi:NSS family neurotransmitter:Na+ symporter
VTEQWGTRAGFVLATLGSAVGLGNIWRFAFVTGENGGGAFVVVYLLALATLAAPLMLAEFIVGARGRVDVVSAFTGPSIAPLWRAVGALMLVVSFVVLSYYVVVAGWALKYCFDAAARLARLQSAYADFDEFVARPAGPVVWQLAFLALTMLVVAAGVRRGIERMSRWLVPLLGVLVIALAVHGVAMPGATRALEFLFAPDWSRLADPRLYIAALGQAFFSVGVGFGVLATYASYAAPRERWTQATLWVCVGDTAFALVASLIAFPAVFTFGLQPTHGPTLAFVTMPQVFADMALGRFLAPAFFFLLVIAALTSAVSLLEVPVAYVLRRSALARWQATLAVGAAAGVCGVPAALSGSVLAEVKPFGRSVLGMIDWLAADLLLPLCAAGLALFVAHALPRAEIESHVSFGRTWLRQAWRGAVRWFAPAAIGALFGWALLA